MNPAPSPTTEPASLPRRFVYVPAIGPRLKALLAVIFAGAALLGATGAYLAAISLLNWLRQPQSYTTAFTLWTFLVHSAFGVAFLVIFVVFGGIHLATSRNRPNRVAVRLGLSMFAAGILVGLTGLALIQLEGLPQLPTGSAGRQVAYWLHVVLPVAAIVLYVLHRKAGPRLKWNWGVAFAGSVAAFCLVMVGLHSQHPQRWFAAGPREGERYFFPSEARTADGKFIPADVLMMDSYCLKCHQDIYNGWFHSAHHFSSFNNPPYLFSVRQSREFALKRDGNVRATRWCAGCHDPVPFFSGAFDDPKFDDVNHATAHAGITCTVCHAITHVQGPTGNAAYTIAAPPHYPFAQSDSAALQWLNNQLVKAKPDFHKQTFLKPFHKTAEFCSTCHKVSLPVALNHYKEFLRGQNHYDTFLLSGVSGHGARSFYYPPQAKTRCAECHMPLAASGDFGSKDFDGSGVRKVHDHLFPAANTGLFDLLKRQPRYEQFAAGFDRAIDRTAQFLKGGPDGKSPTLRIDLFGLKDGGTIDGPLHAPLRPELPALEPGKSYLVEVVVRTLNVGHVFPQGTADSNEIWVDFQATAGGRTIGRSGALANPDESGPVDEWAHFVNVLMLDKDGHRIDRRNPENIFTPLYDHQIPPGSAQVVHYRLDVPADVTGPVELRARVRYRKFDHKYMEYVHKDAPVPKLPVVDLCEDRLTLPVTAGGPVPEQMSPIAAAWQRWNDYGIGCLLEGGAGSKRGELRQAEEAFRKLLTLGVKDTVWHGHVNRARVLIDEGRLQEAATALEQARKADPPAPWWTLAWFNGVVNTETATEREHFDAAIADFERIVDPKNQPADRRFDFTRDYVVLDRLGNTLFKRSQLEGDDLAAERGFLERAVAAFERTLAIDPEDLDAHFGLYQCYARLGREAPSADVAEIPPSEARQAELSALAEQATDAKAAADARVRAALHLGYLATAWGQEATRADRPRLPTYQALIVKLRSAVHAEAQPDVQATLAVALGHLHREVHALLKPDDIARARTTRLYRETHPAANHAAEAIVIYPTNRPGGPGF